jgi:F-type H+-transporting ATPase subunit b
MLNINATLLFQIINFIILIFILDLILFKPLLRLREEREKLTAGKEEESRHQEAQAESMREEYTRKLQEARLKGRMKKELLEKAGTLIEKEMVAKVREEAASILKETKAQIEQEMKKTRESLASQIQLLSSQIAKKILGREIA